MAGSRLRCLQNSRDGQLLLQDGNHRYEALDRAGARRAWVLVYFDDPGDWERFARTLRLGTLPASNRPGKEPL